MHEFKLAQKPAQFTYTRTTGFFPSNVYVIKEKIYPHLYHKFLKVHSEPGKYEAI